MVGEFAILIHGSLEMTVLGQCHSEERSDEESRSRQEAPLGPKNEMLHFVQHDIKGLHSVPEMDLSRATS